MDFTATSAEITILASESSACADLPITDDEVALEGNEVFLVELVTPMGVPSTSPQPSTVTIIDDDGKKHIPERAKPYPNPILPPLVLAPYPSSSASPIPLPCP